MSPVWVPLARVQFQQPGIQPEETDGVGDDDVVSDSKYGTTSADNYVTLTHSKGLHVYFKLRVLFYSLTKALGQRFDVFSFPHPDLLYLTCDYSL